MGLCCGSVAIVCSSCPHNLVPINSFPNPQRVQGKVFSGMRLTSLIVTEYLYF